MIEWWNTRMARIRWCSGSRAARSSVRHEPTKKALIEGKLATVDIFYQPVGLTEIPLGTRPFLRRRAVENA